MRVALVAGEASGDVLGAGLISALAERVPGIECEGVAGAAMRDAGCEVLEEADALAVMGLIEPLKHIPRLLALRRRLVERWSAAPPDVFVGIDAPDFNLGLERRLRERGIPTAHYVSPSVWAWRQGRVRAIGRAADLVLCLFPFEKQFYDRHGVAAEFVGHPLADRLPENPDAAAARVALGINADRVVTIMPGSRLAEVGRLGPTFIAAAGRLAARYAGMRFVTPLAGPATRQLFERQLDDAGLRDAFHLVERRSETAILAGDVVLLASGTASLEAALLGRATVAAYKLAPLTYWLARTLRLVKVRHFALPNHLTTEPLVPEFLQSGASPEALADAVGALLTDDARRHAIERTFGELRETLRRDASAQAAKAVLALAGDTGRAT